jgi:hypothetical protein
MHPEFIEFSIQSSERFSALQRVFAELKHDKEAEHWRTTNELLTCFDGESLRHFYSPPADERLQRLEDLRNRPVIETATDRSSGLTWDFDSLIDAFMNGEYILLRCERVDSSTGRLTFDALAYPYGGVGCMVALIEAFGGVVTGINDGTGFVDFNEQKS